MDTSFVRQSLFAWSDWSGTGARRRRSAGDAVDDPAEDGEDREDVRELFAHHSRQRCRSAAIDSAYG